MLAELVYEIGHSPLPYKQRPLFLKTYFKPYCCLTDYCK